MPKVIGDTRGVCSASQKRVGGASGATGTISPSSSDRRHVVPAFRLDDDDLRVRARPARCPTPARRRRTGRRSAAAAPSELLHDLQPAVPCPATIARIVEARHHDRARFARQSGRRSPRGSRSGDRRRRSRRLRRACPRPSPAGASAGMTMIAADAEPPRGDGHAARMIAGREGDHAPLPLLRRQLQQPVGRAPQLERAAGLQAFAFQPDAAARDSRSRSAASARPVPRSARRRRARLRE